MEPTIIHIYIKGTRENRYFGSPSALFEAFTPNEVGIARQSLLNYWQKTKKAYENEKCIIRKGKLERKTRK